jgi:hypothetical protein
VPALVALKPAGQAHKRAPAQPPACLCGQLARTALRARAHDAVMRACSPTCRVPRRRRHASGLHLRFTKLSARLPRRRARARRERPVTESVPACAAARALAAAQATRAAACLPANDERGIRQLVAVIVPPRTADAHAASALLPAPALGPGVLHRSCTMSGRRELLRVLLSKR